MLFRPLRLAMALTTFAAAAAAAQTATASDSPGVVVPGSDLVRGDRLRTGQFERRVLTITDNAEREAGRIRVLIERLQFQGMTALRSITTVTTPQGVTHDTVLVRAADLAPIAHRSTNPLRTLHLDFDGRSVSGSVVPAGEAAKPVSHITEVPTFDSGLMELLVAALPLETGFAARIPLYVFERDGLVWLDVDVKGTTDLHIAGTDHPTWEVQGRTDFGVVRYFVDRQTREVVRTAFAAPGGQELRIER